jgi:L-seryl-tRNA(Ser) seleniumtransferase
MTDARRAIPSVERLLSSAEIERILQREPRMRVVEMLRAIQDDLRESAQPVTADAAWYAAEVTSRIEKAAQHSLRSVINATGVILHTNLGRAPLARSAIDAMVSIASGYSNLEYDVDAGTRG